jgi:hypothetical protein
MYCWRCDPKYCLRVWLNREYGCDHWYEVGRYPPMSALIEKELLGCGLDDAVKIIDRLYPANSSLFSMLWVLDGDLPLATRYRVWNIELRLAAAGPGEAEAAAHAAATAAAVALLGKGVEAEVCPGPPLGGGDVLCRKTPGLGEQL